MVYKKLLSTRQYIIPRSPAVSAASLEEEVFGEVLPTPTPSSEYDERSKTITATQKVSKRARGVLKQAWDSSLMDQHLIKKLTVSRSVNPMHLEASGTHINRQEKIPNRSSSGNPKGDAVLSSPTLRPYTAIGLCRRSRIPVASRSFSWSSSGSKLEERVAAEVVIRAAPDCPQKLLGVPGNPIGRGAVAMAPEMLWRHPQPRAKRGPRADASFQSSLPEEPLPPLPGAPTHLPSKRLIKVCASPPSRPPQRFHTVCSQAPPRPGVNAHLHSPLRGDCSASAAYPQINACPEQQRGPQMYRFPQNHC
ncbi:PREDICTED: uncharacterized protein C12orf42 homolog [Condylura cristata]|uniref:uncharacterized protein C12orf42 homolog n=1 Tax=Condylura cristata TaxID=143302 RepID=UPI000334733F|nr:PREDICTED: uncharacterized protein C12orf42 homolog [Condylura cristata]